MAPSAYTHIIGIDEAGRGPLAGAVAVGVVIMPVGFDVAVFGSVRDSKQLTSQMRDKVFENMRYAQKNGELDYAVAFSSEKQIDQKGIVPAIYQALKRGLANISAAPEKTLVLLDGGLKAPKTFSYQKTIIRGDETEPVISLASIVAKVSRDRKMITLADKYPEYGFENHKGYGTPEHLEKLRLHGSCEIHRKSYLRNLFNE